jgi:hypothetical protein
MADGSVPGSIDLPMSWPPKPTIESFVDEYWRWHRVIRALDDVGSKHVYGDSALGVVERELESLISYSEEKVAACGEALSGFEPSTAKELKSKAEVLLACYEAELDDWQGKLVKSLARDLIRIPLREYADAVGHVGDLAPTHTRPRNGSTADRPSELNPVATGVVGPDFEKVRAQSF